MNNLQTAAQQALDFIRWSQFVPCQSEPFPEPPSTAPQVEAALEAALAEPVLNPAPGYCKHCKQYTIEEPLPAEPVEEPVAWSYDLATTRLDHRYDGWIRRITQHKPNVPEGSIRNLTPVYHIPPAEKTTGNLVHIKLNVMRTALENIAGIRPIVDNLMSDRDIALIALERINTYEQRKN